MEEEASNTMPSNEWSLPEQAHCCSVGECGSGSSASESGRTSIRPAIVGSCVRKQLTTSGLYGPESSPHGPRWEHRPLRFLELFGVGRTVDDEVDAEERRAVRLDDWMVWEAGNQV